MNLPAAYSLNPQGIHVSTQPVIHRSDEYDPATFNILRDMQSRHFWYLGRHRFILRVMRSQLRQLPCVEDGAKAIDLGGGCGGWISYLNQHFPRAFSELALSDSSLQALEMAGPVVGANVPRYQIDLLDLKWQDRWDVAFLLDVLEHIPDDAAAMRQIWQSLRPGGLLFVTTPALKMFWSYNDDMVSHVRRYSRSDFHCLGRDTGFEVPLIRYFMFFLSPLLILSRLKRVDCASMSEEQRREHLRHTHRVPAAPINRALGLIFAAETPLGCRLPFPWGTSILGVFRKPLS